MKSILVTATALLLSASSVFAYGEPDLTHEHIGDVFQRYHGGPWSNGGVITNGTPTGETVQLGGGTDESVFRATKTGKVNEYQNLYIFPTHGEIRRITQSCT